MSERMTELLDEKIARCEKHGSIGIDVPLALLVYLRQRVQELERERDEARKESEHRLGILGAQSEDVRDAEELRDEAKAGWRAALDERDAAQAKVAALERVARTVAGRITHNDDKRGPCLCSLCEVIRDARTALAGEKTGGGR